MNLSRDQRDRLLDTRTALYLAGSVLEPPQFTPREAQERMPVVLAAYRAERRRADALATRILRLEQDVVEARARAREAEATASAVIGAGMRASIDRGPAPQFPGMDGLRLGYSVTAEDDLAGVQALVDAPPGAGG